MDQPLRVLFVDDHNASRSRMAEAILRAQAGDDFTVASAGTQPQSIDAFTEQLLQQFNMDPGSGTGKGIDAYGGQSFDFVIVLRDEHGGEPAPTMQLPGEQLSWDVPDPAAAEYGDDETRDQSYRRIFELLRQRIQVFVLAQHDELRERGSDHVIGAHQPTDLPAAAPPEAEITLEDGER